MFKLTQASHSTYRYRIRESCLRVLVEAVREDREEAHLAHHARHVGDQVDRGVGGDGHRSGRGTLVLRVREARGRSRRVRARSDVCGRR